MHPKLAPSFSSIIIIIKINGFSQKGFSEPIYKIIS
jgi:hypothetical protein